MTQRSLTRPLAILFALCCVACADAAPRADDTADANDDAYTCRLGKDDFCPCQPEELSKLCCLDSEPPRVFSCGSGRSGTFTWGAVWDCPCHLCPGEHIPEVRCPGSR